MLILMITMDVIRNLKIAYRQVEVGQEVLLFKGERHCYKKMLPQFQLNCINAQDDYLIYLTEAMDPSIHLTSHEQFNPNQVIHLASYSSLGNFMSQILIFFLKHC